MENLTDQQLAAVGAIGGAAIAVYAVVCIALVVLSIIAYWKIFTKAGEKGWKSIIPIYNSYILFKISWKKMWFWIMIGLSVLSGILASVNPNSTALVTIGSILCFAALIIGIIQIYKLSRAYGHGFPFFLGLIFLSIIFIFILAFGSSKYIGPEGKAKEAITE